MPLKDGYCRTDTDGLVYKRDDTFWLQWPDTEDPGILDYKNGATPVPYPEYWEGSSPDPMEDGYVTPTGEFYPHRGEPSC